MMEKYRIPNLHNACQVLNLLSSTPQALSIKVISESLQIPRTTTLRILATLTLDGFTTKSDDCYSLGPALIPIGEAAKARLDLTELARPFLQQVASLTGETCHFAIPSGSRALIIEAVASKHRLSSSIKPGSILDLHCSAVGKCFLAYSHWPDIESVIKEEDLIPRTSATKTKMSSLWEEIEEVRKLGYAVDNEEFIKGGRRIAVPVFSSENQCIAAIGISATSKRLPLTDIEELSVTLKEIAQKLSHLLGWKDAVEEAHAAAMS